MKLIDFPGHDIADIARGLRAVADGIEAGTYGDAHNVAWAVDCGNARVEIGMLGRAPTGLPGADAALLFAIAHQKLIDGAMGK